MSLKEDLKIVISGDPSKFNKALKEAEQNTKRLEAGLASAAKISGVAFAALSATVFGLVKEFRDGEQAAKQLETTLISTGRSSQFTTSELETMALALQDVTTFTDDSIMAAQQAILTFGKIGKTKESFDQVTAASLDLATRMGSDAVSAAKLLGQSLQEPEMALTKLRKAGVSFTDAQEVMIQTLIKTGQEGKAQAIILEQVNKSVGGAAKAAGTGTGAFIQLQNTFGNIAGDLGKHLAPVLISVAEKLNAFLKTVRDNEALVKTAAYVIGIATALTGLVTVVGLTGVAWLKLQAIQKAMAASNITLGASFKALIGATGIGLLVVAITDLAVNWEVRSKQIMAILDSMVVAAKGIFGGLAEIISGAFELDVEKIKSGWKQITDANLESDRVLKEGLKAANEQALADEADKNQKSVDNARESNEMKVVDLQTHLETMQALRDEYAQLKYESQLTNDEVEAQLQQEHLNKTMEMTNKHRKDMANAAYTVSQQDLQKRLAQEKLFAEESIKYGENMAKAREVFRSEEVQGTQQMLGNLQSLSQTGNKKLFKIGQAAAIASAVINTAQAATQALAQFPPPLSFAMAAAQIAAGAIQIGQIKAQKMAQGGLVEGGIPGKDSVPIMAQQGELVAPRQNFDEVVNAVAAQRAQEKEPGVVAQSGGGGGGGSGRVDVNVKIGFSDNAFKLIEQKLIERRVIGVGGVS